MTTKQSGTLQEIERLVSGLEFEIACTNEGNTPDEVPAARAALMSAISRVMQDAELYRWLRQPRKDKSAQGSVLIRMGIGAFSYEIPGGDDLDAAINAIRSKEGKL